MSSSTAHHLSMVSIGFAVTSGWAGSSIITVARRDQTPRPIRRLGSLMGQYGVVWRGVTRACGMATSGANVNDFLPGPHIGNG
jgi:hypothetical protein